MNRPTKDRRGILSLFHLVKDGGKVRDVGDLFAHAMKHESVDVMRLLLKYDSDFASFENFSRCSFFFDYHPRKEEVLKLILENSKDIHEWVNDPNYVIDICTAGDVFMLANHGARFSGKEIFDLYVDFYNTNFDKRDLQKCCALCICGLRPLFQEFGSSLKYESTRRHFDAAILWYRKRMFIRIFMQCGYKTIFCGDQINLSNHDKNFVEEIKHFKKLYSSQPLSLKRLAANVIRKELYPNAVVGSRVLAQVQPGDTSPLLPLQLATEITFGLTQENVEKTLDENWTQ